LERPAIEKQSSFFGLFASEEEKSVITLTPAFRFPDLKGDKKNYLKQFGGSKFRQPVRLK
jgi:hypothetical protein